MNEEFIQKVVEMRSLQRRYYKERSSTILQQCKKAEREVDQLISLHMMNIKPVGTQTTLNL